MDDAVRSPIQGHQQFGESRRTLLRSAAGLVVAWITPARAGEPFGVAQGKPVDGAQAKRFDVAQDSPPDTAARPAAGDLLVRVGDPSLTPLAPDDVPAGADPLMAWPMLAGDRVVRSRSRLNRVLLVRLDPGGLAEPTSARAASGVVAYSAICTHTGCDVGRWLSDEHQLYCECHESKFDPRDAARVTDGPAPRPLPALPLRVEEGRLVVAGPFTARPGFEAQEEEK